MTPNDAELLTRYRKGRSEADFAELVRRYVDLVYSAALRQVGGDADLAKDVAQGVFADLARKSGELANCSSVAGLITEQSAKNRLAKELDDAHVQTAEFESLRADQSELMRLRG